MKEVIIEYRHWGRRRYVKATLPEQLSEATGRQFLALLQLSQGRVTEEEFFLQFFGINEKVLAKLDVFQLYILTEQLRGLWQATKTEHFFIEELTVNVPTLKHGMATTRLLPPEAQLRGMTFQQFMTVDQLYQWYAYTQKDEYLYSMIASLYIPEGTDFQHLDYSLIADNLRTYGDKWKMEGIALNWTMIRAWLSDAYPHLFPQGDTQAKEGQADSHKKPRPGSWLNIFDFLVGEDLTRIDSYKGLACMDVIRILNKRIKAQKG